MFEYLIEILTTFSDLLESINFLVSIYTYERCDQKACSYGCYSLISCERWYDFCLRRLCSRHLYGLCRYSYCVLSAPLLKNKCVKLKPTVTFTEKAHLVKHLNGMCLYGEITLVCADG